jgi:hypothetical protein
MKYRFYHLTLLKYEGLEMHSFTTRHLKPPQTNMNAEECIDIAFAVDAANNKTPVYKLFD